MRLKLSDHAIKKHSSEKWNAKTIRDAIEAGKVAWMTIAEGITSDVIYGMIDGDCVGLIVSKEKNGERIVITGFSAPQAYWKSV